MELRPENIANFCRELRVRSALWFASCIFVLIGALFVFALTMLNIFHPGWAPGNETPPDPVGTACCALFAGVFPAVGAIAGILIGVREVRRAGALEQMLTLFPTNTGFDFALLSERLGPDRAQRAYVDALSRSGLVDPNAPMPGIPPKVSTPAPQSILLPPPTVPSGPGSGPSGAPPPTHPSQRPDPMAATTPTMMPNTTPAVTPHGTPPPAPLVPGGAQPRKPGDITGITLKGTWFVERQLAAGGMGAVYAARHVRTGRNYAIKTMLPDERVSPEALHRFEREARAASALGHAGIIAVHDFDKTDEGVHFIVMDLLEGETLEHRLARLGRLPWHDARRIALEVAEALAAAHRGGILHRDLKPSNVFMSARPGRLERAVLVDFGLAKPIREGGSVWVTRTGAIVGTAHYMAPEQARGERVDERADVYGLGALLYEMIAGVPPFLGANAFAVLTLLLTEQPVAPSMLVPGIPPALDQLVLRALSKSPAERFDGAMSFAVELARVTDT